MSYTQKCNVYLNFTELQYLEINLGPNSLKKETGELPKIIGLSSMLAGICIAVLPGPPSPLIMHLLPTSGFFLSCSVSISTKQF